ncbi:MAG: leucyl/phenylalanyl-tRNA--protein transferase [Deltaproteobacteria bacterium]|jgi:leucyl/phenylalanyl-tRNA--protein transferase|nr:leucyl/phenylalanyl-tRNA--protein transferase [Deltaproteobacteria bacterium]
MNRSTRQLVAELSRAFPFPDPRESDGRGLLAYGGDLGPERLLAAYAQGVFPWYNEPPILWFSPDPRMVLMPADLHVGRSLAKQERAKPFVLTMDTAFEDVIRACREVPRPDQEGTWITPEMVEAYCVLHELGFAHSVEAWQCGECEDGDGFDEGGRRLVGGLYGISLGRAFFGESMFARKTDASKLAFAAFVRQLGGWGFDFVDCQVETEHLARFGATQWTRERFLDALDTALEGETRRGKWAFGTTGR